MIIQKGKEKQHYQERHFVPNALLGIQQALEKSRSIIQTSHGTRSKLSKEVTEVIDRYRVGFGPFQLGAKTIAVLVMPEV